MFQLHFTSPVVTPTSLEIIEVETPRDGAYYGDAFETKDEAVAAQKTEIRAALERWAADGSGSPFWAVAPSGKVCEPPAWAPEYGYRFHDPYLGYGHSHYFHVIRI